ncbi:MAG: methyltransferase domain-containing protein [Candidatus Pseudobacter hemicellulosilyticus]|uniref:Methyltransferase domain-containing protein n=1 Tax=Candidatus Pseudobacter hemicellulosilyticus TaxID=3121375 RepID=A0AAJ5WZ78_9BACT|nr:MAG: methyltransferase domain-containing protein [Pseudobacter sp.]
MTTTPDHLQETDPTGLATLENLAAAKRFNEWMFQTVRPFLKGHVFEAGSGIGNISELILGSGLSLTASDLRDEYIFKLKDKFRDNPLLKDVLAVDLAIPDFEQQFPGLVSHFDSFIALNVVEHIEHADLAIANARKMLKPGGHMVILVPAFQWLYNSFDTELGHFKRYTARTLKQLLAGQQLEVIHSQYFNVMGMAGWFVNGGILKKKMIPAGQLKLYNSLVPAFRLLDRVTFNSMGLSVIAIGRKPV